MSSPFASLYFDSVFKRVGQRMFLLLILLGLYVPLLCFVLLSFNKPSSKDTVSEVLGNWNGIQNYVKFFSSEGDGANLLDALFNSLLIALISIPISLFIGLFTSISIWKSYGKGQQLVFLSSNVTISCPDIIQAISFSFLFSMFAIPPGFFSVIITHVAFQIPYVVIFLYSKLSRLNLNLLLASYDLNFKFFESVLNVIVPALFPNIIGAAMLAFAVSFDDYVITNLVRGNVVTMATELYSMKTGIKMWAAIFGSLVVVGMMVISTLLSCYRWWRGRGVHG